MVYGENASGKSSFADGVEYILADGRIEHLRHEYSDTYLRNCVRNTKTPKDEVSGTCVYFENGRYAKAKIPKNGKIQFESNPVDFLSAIQQWDIKRHILRQDEVSGFVHETKSKKYSVLSPLLGLQIYEDTSENIDNINEKVKEASDYDGLEAQLRKAEDEMSQFFVSSEDEEMKKTVLEHAARYITIDQEESTEETSRKAMLQLDKLLKDIEPETKRYLTLKNMSNSKIREKMETMIDSNKELTGIEEKYVDYRIAILENASMFLGSINDLAAEVECPACGQSVLGAEFKEHVTKELDLLSKSREIKKRATNDKREFSIALSNVKMQCNEKEVTDWLVLPENKDLKELVNELGIIELGDLTARLSSSAETSLNSVVPKLSSNIEEKLKKKPPTTDKILEDYTLFRTALKIPDLRMLKDRISRIEVLIFTLESVHKEIRKKIAEITKETLNDISGEIRRIWTKIHPGQPIENIRLAPSKEAERAVDICLDFYGTGQLSPRLTLSEGYRNSLGLSIFLALANQKDCIDHPIFLDDIVSSLDREHRGMIIDVLREELSERQVFLFTHDREWFGELRERLELNRWKFFALQKWVSPEIGIQLTPSHYTFEEAETLLPNHVKASGNATRAIMDTELPRIAERLELSMPYKQGLRNDHRTCVDFLSRLISEGKQRFITERNGGWDVLQESIELWLETRTLLIAWADRASHSGTLTAPEAKKLIEVCKSVISSFECPNCGKKIWKLSHPEYLRCECGQIRWKL